MNEKNIAGQPASTVCYAMIEAKSRSRIQEWLQDLLEVEATEFLGRAKSQRRGNEAVPGCRNGYSKPRWVALTAGTITVRRPRLRKLAERFGSRVLPLFKRRSAELDQMLPQHYLHGLANWSWCTGGPTDFSQSRETPGESRQIDMIFYRRHPALCGL